MVPIRLPSNAFIIRIPTEPKGKERPRVFGDVTITPAKTATAEREIWAEFVAKYAGCAPFDEPVYLGCLFKCKRERNPLNASGRWDIDNLQKMVQDALNLHAYTDDHWVHRTNSELIAPCEDYGSLIVVAAIKDITWHEISLPGE